MNTQVNNIQNIQPINHEELVEVDAHDRFPEVITSPGQFKVRMRKHRHPDCLSSNNHYYPDIEIFKKAMAWWLAPVQMMPLGLVGETGTGKTELLLYIADRLNEPVYLEKVTTGMRAETLEGGKELTTDSQGNNVTQNRYSKAMQGYKNGGLVIFDEIDKANDDLSTGLHLFLEGKPYALTNFSEIVSKHPMCRITATANTTGEGGHERYTTSQKLDAAIRNRIAWLTTHYPSLEREMTILESQYSMLPYPIRHKMVKTANCLRDALLGPERDGSIDNPVGAPFSTRTICNWAYYCCAFGANRTPNESLDFVYFGSVDSEDRADVKAILQRVWGQDLDKNLSYFIEQEQSRAKK